MMFPTLSCTRSISRARGNKHVSGRRTFWRVGLVWWRSGPAPAPRLGHASIVLGVAALSLAGCPASLGTNCAVVYHGYFLLSLRLLARSDQHASIMHAMMSTIAPPTIATTAGATNSSLSSMFPHFGDGVVFALRAYAVSDGAPAGTGRLVGSPAAAVVPGAFAPCACCGHVLPLPGCHGAGGPVGVVVD